MNKDNFYRAIEEWVEHCKSPHIQLSSSSESVRNCDPYKKIILMGYEALPLIREVYNKESKNNFELSIIQGHGLVSIVREIVGDDFLIPEEIKGRIFEMEEYTKKWLDENMDKFIR